MADKPKIKIEDDGALRERLCLLCEKAGWEALCKWALIAAKAVLPYFYEEFPDCSGIAESFAIQEQRREGLLRAHDVRQAGFQIHALARSCKSETAKYAARAAGQAVGVGHMREHAIVCADYAVKTINCDPNKNASDVTRMRLFQIDELTRLMQL